MWLILGVSKKKGIEVFHLSERSVNTIECCKFLRKINKSGPKKNIVDIRVNVSYHSCERTKTKMTNLKLTPIYNLANRLDLNRIGHVFGFLKQPYRKRRLRVL